MTLDPTVSLGALLAVGVTLFLAALAGYAGYVRLSSKVVEVEGRARDTDKAVEAYGSALAQLRLHVSETCVKKDDLEKIEMRLFTKMDTVEHSIRNALTEVVKAMRPTRRGSE
ncbi:hypothetical protein [Methylobacterium sp. SD21]|uniref:hypothetical protein n=1 Tax=Methylobacterium litchii TaxID=3138810 RepID=UPI00313C1608